jgi:hypothetical protein
MRNAAIPNKEVSLNSYNGDGINDWNTVAQILANRTWAEEGRCAKVAIPRFELGDWVKIVILVVISTFETPQPKSWLAGLGRKRRSVSEGGEWGMQPFELEEWVKRVIMVVVSTFETPQPNSWLAGLGWKRRSVSEGGEWEMQPFELVERVNNGGGINAWNAGAQILGGGLGRISRSAKYELKNRSRLSGWRSGLK